QEEYYNLTDHVAVSPRGQRARLEDAFRIVRRDVEEAWLGSGFRKGQKHGFLQFFELSAPSPLEKGWIVELRNDRGAGVKADAPDVLRDLDPIRETLLKEFDAARPNREEFRLRHVNPALFRLRDELRRL